MIDTGHVGAVSDNTGKAFDAVPLRTHLLTLASKALREVQVDPAHVDRSQQLDGRRPPSLLKQRSPLRR